MYSQLREAAVSKHEKYSIIRATVIRCAPLGRFPRPFHHGNIRKTPLFDRDEVFQLWYHLMGPVARVLDFTRRCILNARSSQRGENYRRILERDRSREGERIARFGVNKHEEHNLKPILINSTSVLPKESDKLDAS